jgi:hypothetical protein
MFCREHATDLYAAWGYGACFPTTAKIAAPDEYKDETNEDSFVDDDFVDVDDNEEEDDDDDDDDNNNDNDDFAFDDCSSPEQSRSKLSVAAHSSGKNKAHEKSTANGGSMAKSKTKHPHLGRKDQDSRPTKKRKPTFAEEEDSLVDDAIVVHECYGYTLNVFLSLTTEKMADMTKRCFGRVCATAMENMAHATRNGEPWPFQSGDSVGALFSQSNGTAWW